MTKRRTIALMLLLLGFLASGDHVRAEDSTAVSLSYSKQRINEKEVLLSLRLKIKPGYKLFALQKKEEDVLFSTITFDSTVTKHLSGAVVEKGTKKTEIDAATQTHVEYFADSVVWEQKIHASEADSFVVKGNLNYLFAKADEYIPGEKAFKLFIKPDKTIAADDAAGSSVANRSLLWIFLAAFGGGLLALLTPCVYSMIPVTVSFFTKRSKTKAEGIRNALYYAASIVVIFTLLGFLVTLIFGPAALNNLATNWVANLIFFALFLVFGFFQK